MHVFCECMIDKTIYFFKFLFVFFLLILFLIFPCEWVCMCVAMSFLRIVHPNDQPKFFFCYPFRYPFICIVQHTSIVQLVIYVHEFISFSFFLVFVFHKLPYHCNTHLLSSCVFISFTWLSIVFFNSVIR